MSLNGRQLPKPTLRRLPKRVVFSLFIALVCASGREPSGSARVEAVRFWSFGDVTRIAVQTSGEYDLVTDQIPKPARVYFDLNGLLPPRAHHSGVQTIPVNDRRLKQIRVAEVSPGKTRIVLDLEAPVDVVSSRLVNPDRLIIELRPKQASSTNFSVAHSATASQIIDLAKAPDDPQATRDAVVAGIPTPATIPARAKPPVSNPAVPSKIGKSPEPLRVPPASAASAKINGKPPPVASPAQPGSTGDQSLVRVFGLKLGKVVIDAGHGGHDTGTIGPHGLTEKDLVLDVALRLGKLVSQRLGTKVVYTRSDDTFISLEERTRIANSEKADLFISIHANSSREPAATGVETYFFNFTSDRKSLGLATRENATSTSSISDLNDLLHKAVLKAKLAESREFAQKIQSCLWASSVKMNNKSRDRGVRQAPFVVLIGADMPSVLAEIGFVSNPHDERLLQRPEQRQKIAEALFKGISQYANTLSHVEIARARTN